MSESRWSWNGLKGLANDISQTRPAQCLYSAGAGLSVAASVAYVGSLFSPCIPASLTCCFASSTCFATTVMKYQQISSNDDRLGKLEKKADRDEEHIKSLQATVEKLVCENQELKYAARQHEYALLQQMEVTDKLVAELPNKEIRKQCARVMAPPLEEGGTFVKHSGSLPKFDSLLIRSEDPEQKINPYVLHGRSGGLKSRSPTPAPDVLIDISEERENEILLMDLDSLLSDDQSFSTGYYPEMKHRA
jgi:ribosomal protein L17